MPLDTPAQPQSHAVVIGASLAGLLAARVLTNHCARVTILDRDRLPEGPALRKGAPQAAHLHLLMLKGQQIVERLFPGFSEEMQAAGASLLDIGADAAWFTPAGLAPRFPSGLPMLMSSRALLEWMLRRRVRELAGVAIRQGCEVERLTPGGAGVGGVEIRVRDEAGGARTERLPADLVVDASGRGSRAPEWLTGLGYDAPAETRVDARLGYATRIYRRGPAAGDWRAAYVQAKPPHGSRGGGLFPLEDGRWICTLYGVGGDYPPTEEAGFLAFARSLATPDLARTIQACEPLGPILGWRATENRRRHYERLARLPDNFLVTGDAACAFNPVYGQGMSNAAAGAAALQACLAGSRRGLSRRFQRRFASASEGAWLLATGEDYRVPGVEARPAGLSVRLTHRYMDRVLALSLRDLAVRRVFLEVFQMLKPPTALFAPPIAFKALLGPAPAPAPEPAGEPRLA